MGTPELTKSMCIEIFESARREFSDISEFKDKIHDKYPEEHLVVAKNNRKRRKAIWERILRLYIAEWQKMIRYQNGEKLIVNDLM